MHVDVRATPEDVWRAAADWDRQGEWMPLTRVRHTGGPELAVGTRALARTGVGPLGFDDPMTVTAVAAPNGGSGGGAGSYEVLHTGRVVRGVGAFTVEPSGRGSRFSWWERIEVPGGPFAPALWLVGRPLTRLAFGWALRRFARSVEAE